MPTRPPYITINSKYAYTLVLREHRKRGRHTTGNLAATAQEMIGEMAVVLAERRNHGLLPKKVTQPSGDRRKTSPQ